MPVAPTRSPVQWHRRGSERDRARSPWRAASPHKPVKDCRGRALGDRVDRSRLAHGRAGHRGRFHGAHHDPPRSRRVRRPALVDGERLHPGGVLKAPVEHHASVVDPDVDAPEALDRLSRELGDRSLAADVGRDRNRVRAARRTVGATRPRARFRREQRARAAAAAGHCASGRGADAAGGAGDHHDRVLRACVATYARLSTAVQVWCRKSDAPSSANMAATIRVAFGSTT